MQLTMRSGRRDFAAAAWPMSLKVVSALATMALLGAMVVAYRAIPAASGFTHRFGVGVALVPVAVLVGSALMLVKGYAVDATDLYIRRLLWSTRVPLGGISRA